MSSAYLIKLRPLASNSLSSLFKMIFDNNGERGPPCGVPTIVSSNSFSTKTPAFRNLLTNETTFPSFTTSLTKRSNLSCGTLSKNFSRSISTTQS